ncbi:DUF3137 domain-containing protein [Haloactinopolyspora sp.]|uniref:DUF3137 domain-containing protein n=1 Tax=Haloactinopolyspora sp. TaxID=1966353 RepID=UPI002615B6A8|nr:DUF3137 domain-containing protein [Haloactinopolyspora sp.]
MEIVVVTAFIVIAGVVGLGVHGARRSARRHASAMREGVRARGWSLAATDDDIGMRWRGEPFRARAGHPRNVVRGSHRGHDFAAFDYVFTAKPTPNADTAIPHRFAVWALPLPASVPTLSVTARHVLSPKVSAQKVTWFGGAHVATGDPEFDEMFAVECADDAFVAQVLQPPLLEHLKQAGRWNWRFEDDTMISFQKGRLDAAGIAASLDRMIGVLEHVSRDVWRHA